MVDKIQAIRGMNDILPAQAEGWRILERIFAEVLGSYGYGEIRTPMLESTRLFKRSIGEVTDIVEKEMYTFTDLNGDSLTLRPEGTASVVRSAIEQGLLHNQQQKLWYCGPMFRHEKPQKGRYRQFHQLGIEAFGYQEAAVEIEQLLICQKLWKLLGLEDVVRLEINSIGTLEEREAYKKELIAYLEQQSERLDPDSQRRLYRNPLRILDSKNPEMAELIQTAPKLIERLGEESKSRFDALCSGLNALDIPYHINPNLVRGLDYYCHTVFEWTTDKLGSQSTVCAGGRYDGLVEQLGGKSTAATGFALGIERLLLLILEINPAIITPESRPLIFFITDTSEARLKALQLAEQIRLLFPKQEAVVNLSGGSFKNQFKKADKSNARFAAIIGTEEYAHQTITIKDLRTEQEQQQILQSELGNWLLRFC